MERVQVSGRASGREITDLTSDGDFVKICVIFSGHFPLLRKLGFQI